jgi:hypothetical protein
VYDVTMRGLCVHATKSNKSFYPYRKLHGRPVRFKLGPFPELTVENARKAALKHLGQMVEGKDPRDERRAIRTSITLEGLFENYQADGKLRHTPRTQITDKSRFETCLGDWKARKLATIRESDVRAKHADLAQERGTTSANRAVQLLRRMFNFARLSPNPAANRAVTFFRERARDRFLQADELPAFSRR